MNIDVYTKPLNLFCLPFAGGNKYSYREFIEKSPPFIKMIGFESPGRGSRMRESLLVDMEELVDDLYRQVKPFVDQQDYAIYGHSMGGLASYLLTTKLIREKHRLPQQLFITGTTGPSAVSRQEKKRYLLEKEAFISEIRELDGMPEEILQNDELLHYFEPILRADFQASETYSYKEHAPLDIPFTVITGTEEDMEAADIKLWQNETKLPVDFKRIPGKHFFIFKHSYRIVEIIAKKIVNTAL